MMAAYLQLVGRQSLKRQENTRRCRGAEREAGFCREQIPQFSLAVFSVEFPWSDPVVHQLCVIEVELIVVNACSNSTVSDSNCSIYVSSCSCSSCDVVLNDLYYHYRTQNLF